MTRVTVYSSDLFDRIAAILVHAELVDLTNHSLYRWFAKSATDDITMHREFHAHLLDYIQSGDPSPWLVDFVKGFPQMFDWFGRDIVQSEHARSLVELIGEQIEQEDTIQLDQSARKATQYLNDLGIPALMQDLVDCRWPGEQLKLVAARDIFNQCYVYPDTIICRTDPTFAEYVAMLAHEGGHILTLDLVNDPEILGQDHQLGSDIAEALAHAIQMCIVDRCAISYEDLFPGQNVLDHESYINSHPWRRQKSALIRRLVAALEHRNGQPLAQVYRQVFEEFAG